MNTIIKNFVYVIIVSSALFIIFMMGVYSWGDWYDEWSGYNASQYVSDGVCNIAVVPIHGSILGYENEYGSYSNDRKYLNILQKLWRTNGIEVPFYTADGAWVTPWETALE